MIEWIAGVLVWAMAMAVAPQDVTATGVIPPSSDGQSFADAAAAFDARLRQLHPPGSEVADLRQALVAQGFVLEPGSNGEQVGTLDRNDWFCQLRWIVVWTEEATRVATIRGDQDGVCL